MYKYKCEICERPLKKKNKLYGYVLCSKHMHQLLKYGKFLDNIQRTNSDKNDFTIDGEIAVFNLYNQKNIKVGEFIIDAEDVNKVRNYKWRISHNHVVTGNKYKGKNNVKDLSWIILNIQNIQDNVVDHINHNPFDNRKSNLRICKQNENTQNVSIKNNNSSGFVGISYLKKRNKWNAEIKINYKKIHLGEYVDIKKAVYARMLAENFFFQDFKNIEEYNKKKNFTKDLDSKSKKEIYEKIYKKYINFKTQNI